VQAESLKMKQGCSVWSCCRPKQLHVKKKSEHKSLL